jgi:two-component system, chemotaxis family, chemotaxis protein CheY
MKPSNILVVDDEEMLASTLAELICMEGFNASFCEDPLLALKMKDTADYDLIISDIAMPKLTGIEMMKRWGKESRDGKPPSVIFVTGHIDTQMPVIDNVNVIALMMKPVNIEDLLRLIGQKT